MINILIIDSEYESIKNIRNYIVKNYKDIKTIEYLNTDLGNNQTEKIIESKKINLIFLDMRFFGAYSYKKVSDLYNKYPQLQFVYYGMMTDAMYINKCMELTGVTSMYRPVKPADINYSIKMTIDKLSSIHDKNELEKKIQHDVINDKKMFKAEFLRTLVAGKINKEHEIKSSFLYYDLDFFDSYRTIILRIDSFRQIALTLTEIEKQTLLYRLLESVKADLKDVANITFTEEFNTVVSIICIEVELSKIISKCEKIKERIYKEIGVRVSLGIGRQYKKEREIGISYNEADGALRYRFYLGYNSVIPIEFVEPNNFITYRYPHEDENKLICAAVIGEFEYCKSLLNKLVIALVESGVLQETLFSKIIITIIFEMSRFSEEQGLSINDKFRSFFDFNEILKVKNTNEFQVYLISFLEKFCEYAKNMHEELALETFNKVLIYLDENYKKRVSLNDLAEQIGTSVEYLNKIFAVQKNMSISSYVDKIRIEEAKKIMRETNSSDEEISSLIGYENVKYFRSIFENIEKLTTSNYRTKYGKFFQGTIPIPIQRKF